MNWQYNETDGNTLLGASIVVHLVRLGYMFLFLLMMKKFGILDAGLGILYSMSKFIGG